MARRAPAGKARHRKVKTAPEEVHRTRLAEEAGAELLEHGIDVDEDLEKTPNRFWIVGGVPVVLRKTDRLRQFVRHLVDICGNAERGEIGHHSGIEARDGFSGQCKSTCRAVAGRNSQDMIDEVEVDLKV